MPNGKPTTNAKKATWACMRALLSKGLSGALLMVEEDWVKNISPSLECRGGGGGGGIEVLEVGEKSASEGSFDFGGE